MMTLTEAHAEAIHRWGKEGVAIVRPDRFLVGVYIWSEDPDRVVPEGWDHDRYGEGASWEEAFTDADQRKLVVIGMDREHEIRVRRQDTRNITLQYALAGTGRRPAIAIDLERADARTMAEWILQVTEERPSR